MIKGDRVICSQILTNLIKFNYEKFEKLVEIFTPQLKLLHTRERMSLLGAKGEYRK